MVSAIVVGSGPNGLAAAITLAARGVHVTVLEAADEIGGGARTAELTVPGLLHDVCSAVHPMAIASPFFSALDLPSRGLDWIWPEIDVAHPLADGRAGVLTRDLARSTDALGSDGQQWSKLVGLTSQRFSSLAEDLLRPLCWPPTHPVLTSRFGVTAAKSAVRVARRWRGDKARALWAGLAAHAQRPLTSPGTGGMGLVFAASVHACGWPVARGGSAAITRVLADILIEHGGMIETGHRVSSLPAADMVLFDTSVGEAVMIAGDSIPGRVRRALHRFPAGPAVFKVDLAVHDGIPWTNVDVRMAGTVHVGGTLEEITASEKAVHDGIMPERPFVLVAQQYLADPSRSAGGLHPVWAYAHVPRGYAGDATNAVISQIERFAPGVRERIGHIRTAGPAHLAAMNPNYIGGDISGGANDLWHLLARPRLAPNPYYLGAPGLYLCSSSTPPGAGVHGMAGHLAARSALKAAKIM